MTYKVEGSCSDSTVSFRAITVRAYDASHTINVFLYLNADGTASLNVDSPQFIATTWKAIDDNNFTIDKLGTLSYYEFPGSPAMVSLITQNSYFPTLPIGEFTARANTEISFSSTGQIAAQYCSK